MTELDPIAPEAAVELYLEQRRGDVSAATLDSHESRLSIFVDWCEDNGIHNLNDLTGRHLHEYRVHRREEDGVNRVTLKTQLSTLRVFLGVAATFDAVPKDLKNKLLLPTLDPDSTRSESSLSPERGESILEWLDKYEYASRDHVLFSLLWRTGMRSGSVRALDLEDFQPDDLALEVRHRPETDTPLKNQARGQRDVALSPSLATLIEDYIDGPRTTTTDDYGRTPLLSTQHGRPSRTTIRHTVYRWTRPCYRNEGCPHDREIDSCEATHRDQASKCPSSRSPHDCRSGAITAHLLDDVPLEIVSERMDVTMAVLDRHYDRRSEREKMEQRRQFLEWS